ncbi:MAG: hypothetical protein ACKKMW_01595 [Candidatus Nealsonbacteria bacterium]
MKKEDLIKKLENIKTPNIEIQSHKQWLKLALLNSGYFKEKTIMFYTKRLVPAGVALALILVVGFTVIQPRLQIARAMEIAKNDPQIKELIEEYGVEIKEVKLQDGKAYVLLTLPGENLPPELEERTLGTEEDAAVKGGMRGPGQFYISYLDPATGEITQSSGSVAEIDLKAAEVTNLKQIGIVEPLDEGESIGKYTAELKKLETIKIDITPLTEEEEARAIEIAKSEPKIQEMIPDLEEREIIVKPLPPLKLKLHIDEDLVDGGLEISSADLKEDKRANVIFKSDEYQDIITVNLTTGKVEGAVSYGTGSRIEKPELERPYPIKPKYYLEPSGIKTLLPNEGSVKAYEVYEGSFEPANQKEIFAAILKEIGEKDERIKDLLKDNDYEILEVIRSKLITTKTETGTETRVETATVVLEKESTGENYWITIDLGSMTVKSIEIE